MKLLEKLKDKKVLSTIITLIVGVVIGSTTAPVCSESKHDGVENKVLELENTIQEKDTELKEQNAEIEELNKKVSEAGPYFKMTAAEKEALEIEATKQEEKNRIEKEKLEKEQKQAELESRSITLGNGTYLVGKDIPEGVYDLYAVKGGGNVQSSGQVNIIMGVKGDSDFYQREEQNVALRSDTTISLRNVTIKFVPDDGYVINN
ncbi:MAG: hypothetical protein J6D47_04740 [Peptostreptococcaceae bacterium]|nr:hypothetical protein [Peptostreptococcaceae bacterium]